MEDQDRKIGQVRIGGVIERDLLIDQLDLFCDLNHCA